VFGWRDPVQVLMGPDVVVAIPEFIERVLQCTPIGITSCLSSGLSVPNKRSILPFFQVQSANPSRAASA
jgi:hypothetical protein